MRNSIDINCDLGEGVGNEAQLMPLLSSCNIACGAHAGNENIMRETAKLAIENKTRIGAHPSFPDRENFGRTEMSMEKRELAKIVKQQIERLVTILKDYDGTLHHIKPHGALYNMASVNREIASAILDGMEAHKEAFLYAPCQSMLASLAEERSFCVKFEAFADRNYNDDLTLVSRTLPNATLHSPDEIFEHVFRMIRDQQVKTVTGNLKSIKADTICVHGDNPNAVEIVSFLSRKLKEHSISIEKA